MKSQAASQFVTLRHERRQETSTSTKAVPSLTTTSPSEVRSSAAEAGERLPMVAVTKKRIANR
jgi:hypothetical protein